MMTCPSRTYELAIVQKRYGVRSSDLAYRMQVSRQQISRWRKTNGLKLTTIKSICEAMDITLGEFVDAICEGGKQTKD